MPNAESLCTTGIEGISKRQISLKRQEFEAPFVGESGHISWRQGKESESQRSMTCGLSGAPLLGVWRVTSSHTWSIRPLPTSDINIDRSWTARDTLKRNMAANMSSPGGGVSQVSTTKVLHSPTDNDRAWTPLASSTPTQARYSTRPSRSPSSRMSRKRPRSAA